MPYLILMIILCYVICRVTELMLIKAYKNNKMIVNFNTLNDDINADIGYKKVGDSGMDIRSSEDLVLTPGSTAAIKTALELNYLDKNCEIQVRPRSGLALKNGITVLNTPGTIDSGYRNEIKVILHNSSVRSFKVVRGMRIAQLVIMEVVKDREYLRTDEKRGKGGFGSTGVN